MNLEDLSEEEIDAEIKKIFRQECGGRGKVAQRLMLVRNIITLKNKFSKKSPNGDPYWLNFLVQYVKDGNYSIKRAVQRVAEMYGYKVKEDFFIPCK